jgi:triosephosphate isomerase (TIM)
MARGWSRRPRLVAGNWKMNKTAPEAAALAATLAGAGPAPGGVAIAVCPPFTALASVAAVLGASGLHLGGQNLHPEPRGAFTGEVSGPMLAALGCRFVIVGHSERRHGMGEDDALVAKKLRAALRDGLIPIVCVGETLPQREAAQTDAVLSRQIEAAYHGLPAAEAEATVVAYEPVWAIGTGKVATPDQARLAHATIRSALDRAVGPGTGERLAVLYGGSVSPENAAALFAEEQVDGALVGGASLEAASFRAIVEAAAGAGDGGR